MPQGGALDMIEDDDFALSEADRQPLTNDELLSICAVSGITEPGEMAAEFRHWQAVRPVQQRQAYRAMMRDQVPLVDDAAWIGREPPAREWVVPEWLARGTGALFVGMDGVGKSLLGQQLCTCVATGRRFLGLDVVQSAAIYLTCEDDELELWRRQRGINAALSSFAGKPNAYLGTFEPTGEFVVSPMLRGIAERGRALGAGLIILDNIAHLFTGNENARRDVASFCSAIDGLAMDLNATVVAVGHPSKGGAEYSGSTGWSAHVRQRWFMERPEIAEGIADRDERVLRKSKANYSEAGSELRFWWHQWAFVSERDLPPDRASEIAETAAAANDNALFLACLAERERQGEGRYVGPTPGPNYAPTQFEGMREAKGIKRARLKLAMERLFAIRAIESHTYRNTAKGRNVTIIRATP